MTQPPSHTTFEDLFSEEVWRTTYKDHTDNTVDDTLMRVAKAASSVEQDSEYWTQQFYDLLSDFKGTVGGRIYSNAGTEWGGTTMLNCYVGPRSDYDIDSLDNILLNLKNQANTLKSEGGWGENFSYIRPRGSFIHGIGVETPGAVKYMELFDKSSEIITSGSGKKSTNKKAKGKIRKGAMMAVLDVWHPDIIEFITAKQQPGRLTKFNMSVNCTDEFMDKVVKIQQLYDDGKTPDSDTLQSYDKWDLVFPDTTHSAYKQEWSGDITAWKNKNYPVIIHNTVSVLWLWNLITESTYNRNEPGVLYLDRANHFNPLNYEEKIFATNPCFIGSTLIPTNKGLVRFDQLVESDISDIKCYSSNLSSSKDSISLRSISAAFCSGIKQTIKVHLSNGMEFECTPDHKLYLPSGEWKEAQYCKGESLTLHSNFQFNSSYDFGFDFIPNYDGKNYRTYNTNLPTQWTEDLATVVGWLVGDGWITSTGIGLIFGKEDGAMMEHVISILQSWDVHATTTVDKNDSTTLYVSHKKVLELFTMLGVNKVLAPLKRVPQSIFTAPKNIVSKFLAALFSADGSVLNMKNSNYWVSLCSSSKLLLNDVQQLLLMYGIEHHTVYHIKRQSVFKYVTVSGEDVEYAGNEYYDLRIFGHGIVSFYNEIGFQLPYKQVKLEDLQDKNFKNKSPQVTVVNIEPGSEQMVYDLTQPEYHNFIVNGVVVHNCGEQQLSPGNVCLLGSINITQFIDSQNKDIDYDRLSKYVKIMTRLLDNINDVSKAPLEEYVYSMKNKRRIGLGILGWASALLMMKVRFGSDVASIIRDKMMQAVAVSAYEASIDLAEEKGMFKLCQPELHASNPFVVSLGLSDHYMNKLKTVGIRNSSLLSIQPTGNTSILANIVSGGLEPIFMPEYIRTVIVSVVPDDIKDVTPKWYEGEWTETSLFKFAYEGDEQILRGVSQDGIVYKIDKNRGLTKEVLCEDYGVRHLKAQNEWEPTADWAVTTTELSVQDHLTDLKGFAKYVDSAMSKTINIPNDYPFEDFKKIYLDAYSTGYIKGLTTYRAGTMTTVLSAKEQTTTSQDEEEIILDDVKMPDSTQAVMKTIRTEGRKWYLTLVYTDNPNRPFGMFVQTNAHEKTVAADEAVELLTQLAIKKQIPSHHIETVVTKCSTDSNSQKVARMISFLLRHGVLIKNIVAVLDRVETAGLGSFVFHIKKFLATYIRDGETVENEKCDECSGTVVFREGCKICTQCGSSKCS